MIVVSCWEIFDLLGILMLSANCSDISCDITIAAKFDNFRKSCGMPAWWSAREDQRLLEIVPFIGVNKWAIVAEKILESFTGE